METRTLALGDFINSQDICKDNMISNDQYFPVTFFIMESLIDYLSFEYAGELNSYKNKLMVSVNDPNIYYGESFELTVYISDHAARSDKERFSCILKNYLGHLERMWRHALQYIHCAQDILHIGYHLEATQKMTAFLQP